MADPMKPPKAFKEQQLNKSKGILDDHAVRKSISSREGNITNFAVTNLKADHIAEKTSGHEIVIDNNIELGRFNISARRITGDFFIGDRSLLTGDVVTDTITEETADAGVTVEGVNFKDNNLTTTGKGRFDDGIGVGIDATTTFPLNICGSRIGYISILIENTYAGANSQIRFDTVGKAWAVGLDDSTDKFVFARYLELDTNIALTIDNSLNFDFQAGNLTTTGDIILDSNTNKIYLGDTQDVYLQRNAANQLHLQGDFEVSGDFLILAEGVFSTDLIVGNLSTTQSHLKLKGKANAFNQGRGGSIEWYRDDTNIGGYLFVNNNNQLVWKKTAQSSHTDIGLGYVDLDNGNIVFGLSGIPTTDPSVAGQLWRDGTDLKISLG